MKNTLIFITFYMKVLLKNRKAATLLWLAPIFFLLGAAMAGSHLLKEEARVQVFKVAIVNDDPTVETKLVIRQLTESRHLNGLIRIYEVGRPQAEKFLQNDEVAAAIYIPEGFSRDVARGENTPVKVVGNPRRPLQSQLIRHVMESAADFTSAAQSGINTVDYFMEEADFSEREQKSQFKKDILSFSLHILGRGEIFSENQLKDLFQQSLVQYYAISFYILLMMIWSYLGLSLLKTNVSRSIYFRLTGLGISAFQTVSARMLSAFLFVFVSSVIAGVPLLLWQEIGITPYNLVVLIGGIIPVALMFTTLFMLLETVFHGRLHQFISMAAILFGAIIGEHFIPAVYFPDWLQSLNAFSVNGWALKFGFSLFQEEAFHAALKPVAILLLVSAVNIAATKLILSMRKGEVQ